MMEANTVSNSYAFNVKERDTFGGGKLYTVTNAVTDKILFTTTQKKVLKKVLSSIFFKKSS